MDQTYVHLFKVTTDCPHESAAGVKCSLLANSSGYKFEVTELPVLTEEK